MRNLQLKAAATFILLVAVNQASGANSEQPLKPGFNLYSKQQDIDLGKQAAATVRGRYQTVQNPELQAYIRKVGERLAQTPTAAASGFPFSFTLLNYKEVNAFALPGGPTFIFTGLIKAADNEGELAGVLAHEISHVVLRHGTHEASRQNLIEKPALIIGAINSLTALGRIVNLGLGLQLNGIFLKYSRTDESQADALGTHIMAEAGYDPLNLARFFEKLESQGGPGVPEFLSDHPSPGNRVEAVKAEARALPARHYQEDDREFEHVKVVLASLPPPPDFRSKDIAVTTGNDEGYNRLNTPQFSIEYPSSWHVHGDPQSPLLAVAPEDGIAVDSAGNPALGYGVLVGYFFPNEGRSSLDEATNDLIEHLHTEDPGMHRSESQKPTTAGNEPAIITELAGNSPLGDGEKDMLVTVERPQGLYYMIFVSPEQKWPQTHMTFERMLNSLHFVP
jgi:beta-barrel assembly-enhancing protease